MNNIEEEAIKTFQINLAYFAKEHTSLYKKITTLNQAIENGSFKERYSLEYKDNYFDVLELSSGNYLYNQNSYKHAKDLTKKVNYKKSEAVIEGFYNRSLTDAQVDKLDGKININNSLFATARLMQYNARVTSRDDEMKEIFKFIFCGVGLGIHIDEIEKKTGSKLLFIMEDDIELFRLSLFTTNYQNISLKATLFFSIMDNDIELKQTFDTFFARGATHNKYIKYATLSQNDISKIKRIQNFIVLSSHLIYPYSMRLKEVLKAPEYIVEKYSFVNISGEYNCISPLSSKPVLLIASGPSLGNNAQWLQDNKHKFYIVAVLSSTRTLYELGIKPDIVTHMDAQSHNIKLIRGIDKEDFFSETLFIFSSVTSRNIIDSFPKNNVYLFESASDYKQGFRRFTAPSIGETTYAISLLLGAKELYLLGLDLALDSETGLSHSKEHSFAEKKDLLNTNEQYTSIYDTVFYVKGNFLDQVPTTNLFDASIKSFNLNSKILLTTNQNVYNLNNGAYLDGTKPLYVKDLNTNDFTNLNKIDKFNKLKLFLDSISEDEMSITDIEYFNKQLEEAQRLYSVVQKFKELVTTTNYIEYIQQMNILHNALLNQDGEELYDINAIFATYLQLVIGYIIDTFNTKNLKNQKEHIKNINEIYIRQLIKILDLYLITMRVYRKWIES